MLIIVQIEIKIIIKELIIIIIREKIIFKKIEEKEIRNQNKKIKKHVYIVVRLAGILMDLHVKLLKKRKKIIEFNFLLKIFFLFLINLLITTFKGSL